MQADAYASFDRLDVDQRQPGPIVEAACWAHYLECGFIWGTWPDRQLCRNRP
jgi:hypothetical protein